MAAPQPWTAYPRRSSGAEVALNALDMVEQHWLQQWRHTVAVKLAIGIGTGVVILAGYGLRTRARAQVNDVALASQPKPVSVVEVQSGTYQAERHYVAVAEPWIMADVGPQIIAAFVDTVLVRPGDRVRRGQVLATLDCRDANATNRAVAAQARAIDARQKALADEAARVSAMVDGGFAAPNEAEQKLANSESELAQLTATQAKLAGTSLAVNDCVLRSAFDGEVANRYRDPGAFVRPGTPIVSVIDRSTVRVSAEVPEGDFAHVAPGTGVRLRMLATGVSRSGAISRRSPVADGSTRTVHIEIDIPDPEHSIPVGTTVNIEIKVGTPEPAAIIPGNAAAVPESSATIFIAEANRAKRITVKLKGESLGTLYLDPSLTPGTRVVVEGRSLLADGDAIAPTLNAPPVPGAPAPREGSQ